MNARSLSLPTDEEMREINLGLLEEAAMQEEEQRVVMGGVSDCGETYIDKSGWGPGPWQDEPDKLEFVDKDTGYPCLIRRNAHYGTLCGYVAIPDTPARIWPKRLKVHGGVNFVGRHASRVLEGVHCNIPLRHSLTDDDTWWLGFDAAHAYDICPSDANKTILDSVPEWSYKDIEYMKDQCRSLARQIALDEN